MNLLKQFIHFIKTENLFQQKDRLIIGVSGGIDSVVLCELCHQSKVDFVISHCNFQLRGQESERDEQFVRNVAEQYGVKVFVKKFETENFASKNKLSIQVAARELRYDWFKELIEEIAKPPANILPQTSHTPHAVKLATAHHANDNIETLMMNFFRGTGISGLRGILPKQNNIIRPLLFATRNQITAFAAESNLSFVEDSSNLSEKYTRNYFRHQLIPLVQKVFPKAEDNLKDNFKRFREIEMLYQQSILTHKKKLLEHKGEEIHIPVLKLLKAKPLFTLIYEVIKDFNFTAHQTDEVINLLKSETGKYVQSASHKIIKNRNWLIISPCNTLIAHTILIEQDDKAIEFENGKLKFEKLSAINFHPPGNNLIASVDMDEIKFPLLLRKWKQGDYFYPLGMNKKKKLNRFLTDQKMAITEKENTWVIEMDKKIMWVVGKRIDDRFKILPHTRNIMKISLH
ncbi:MAG: tRNA lysidine(34) synthetase TilS [Ginsengibacter sp.]